MATVAGLDHFFYLCSVIDVYDRSLLAYHIGWHCTAEQALRALQQAVARRQDHWAPDSPPVIRTDLSRIGNYADKQSEKV